MLRGTKVQGVSQSVGIVNYFLNLTPVGSVKAIIAVINLNYPYIARW